MREPDRPREPRAGQRHLGPNTRAERGEHIQCGPNAHRPKKKKTEKPEKKEGEEKTPSAVESPAALSGSGCPY